MPRTVPSPAQNFLSSVILPLGSVLLLPVSALAVVLCILHDRFVRSASNKPAGVQRVAHRGCVIISGGRMTKGLTLARAFKRAGWKVIGVEEEGWGELCPMRFSSAVDAFHILPPAASSYAAYSAALLSIAQHHKATLFIPVSGAGSSVEDARAADEMFKQTGGRCRTFIQDPETMLDLHDKDRFMALVEKLGFATPKGQMVKSVDEAMAFLEKDRAEGPKYILKCMGLDENRGDMTLYPIKRGREEKRTAEQDGDERRGRVDMTETRRRLEGLKLAITDKCPYVFQEFIPGQEYCTHAAVVDGKLTSFVTCPSNDMLMTYEDITTSPIGRRAEQWTTDFLGRLQNDPAPSGATRRLTGHFSFDFIVSTKNGEMYPLECNARVHTATILLPLDRIALAYDPDRAIGDTIVRPPDGLAPRSWIYNDLIMRYLPQIVGSRATLASIHPCLPACKLSTAERRKLEPSEELWKWRVDPTLVADDWVPFLVLWHVWWPALLVMRWWQGKKWTRLNVSTGRIFEA